MEIPTKPTDNSKSWPHPDKWARQQARLASQQLGLLQWTRRACSLWSVLGQKQGMWPHSSLRGFALDRRSSPNYGDSLYPRKNVSISSLGMLFMASMLVNALAHRSRRPRFSHSARCECNAECLASTWTNDGIRHLHPDTGDESRTESKKYHTPQPGEKLSMSYHVEGR